MKKIFLVFLVTQMISCGFGTPDDESSCDKGRALALMFINSEEIRKRNSDPSATGSNFSAFLYLGSFCSSDLKKPGP